MTGGVLLSNTNSARVQGVMFFVCRYGSQHATPGVTLGMQFATTVGAGKSSRAQFALDVGGVVHYDEHWCLRTSQRTPSHSRKEMSEGVLVFRGLPGSHHHQRQRNHQRCPSASPRSVTFQRELLVIECIALQLVRELA